jgi:myosin protein heavy chain
MTDRQLAEQVSENKRLNLILKSMENHRHRLQGDLEDLQRQHELLKKTKNREARAARASLGPEDKTAPMKLEEERKARAAAEAKVASLERDLQDQRRRMATNALSPKRVVSSSSDGKLVRAMDEITRLVRERDELLSENERLASQVSKASPRSLGAKVSSRTELLRGLQQSHEALGRDMSDQLRRLDTAPLTPSRRANSDSMPPPSTSAADAKRMRSLETEIAGLRQLLADEQEEKEFIYERLQEQHGGGPKGKRPFPCKFPWACQLTTVEQAMYSHFRLKAKSLRSQLDQCVERERVATDNSQLAHDGGSERKQQR